MSEQRFFTEREFGDSPRNSENITESFWGGIVSLIQRYIDSGYLAENFPKYRDREMTVKIGCDTDKFRMAIESFLPDLRWPLNRFGFPPGFICLDLIEYIYQFVSKPIIEFHDFFECNYYSGFDDQQGKVEYVEQVNILLRRNNLAFNLHQDGHVRRLLSEPLQDLIESTYANTEDQELNRLIETAKEKIMNPDVSARKDAVEKLWDAFVRLKTIEEGQDTLEKIKNLLNKAIPEEKIREYIDAEAIKLTEYGNKFQIRHSETDTIPLEQPEYIDYLFHRLFSLIDMLLKRTGRAR